jgi:hypothetical protein
VFLVGLQGLGSALQLTSDLLAGATSKQQVPACHRAQARAIDDLQLFLLQLVIVCVIE